MLSLLLFREIAQMFVALFLGYLIVRLGLLKSEDSKILSVIALYIITPCVTINAYQIEITADRLLGMLLALAAAILTHAVYFLLTAVLRKPLRLSAVEQASLLYSNAANLTIPIVNSVLGAEWVLYVSMYGFVQRFLLWSHCRMLLRGENQFSLKKVLLNVNIIARGVGISLFFLRIPLPGLLKNAMASIGGMIAPVTMIVAGMLMGAVSFGSLFKIASLWKIAFLRLLAFPLAAVLIMKYSGLATLAPAGETILLVSLLSSVTPSASVVTQLAQVYSDEGQYAGLINVTTTLLCIFTIPVMIAIYQM